jgi:carotenoid 1,2-hydratase
LKGGSPCDIAADVATIPVRGYRWWYVDGLSDDGRRGFTAIFMIGSVFSPWARARALRGEAVPAHEHLSLHLALYENEREVAWTMSERGGGLYSDARTLRYGGSELRFADDGGLEATFEELTAPPFFSGIGIGSKIRGRMRMRPGRDFHMNPVEIGRAPEGATHNWQVRVPHGRIEVEFDRPGFSFQGGGYHDTNWGGSRLEEAFTRWSWARFQEGDRTRILYAVEPRAAEARGFVIVHGGDDSVDVRAARPARFAERVPVAWGLRAPDAFTIDDESGGEARVVRWLDRTPFYARYVAALGEVRGVGEYLDLDRYGLPTVQFLLRWRAQRR